jgi:ribonucleoside-diphosphate reductase alpha chain
MNNKLSLYQDFIRLKGCARWVDSLGRRETWAETVSRYMDFMREHLAENCGYKLPDTTYKEVYDAIYKLDVVPSMRALATAGEALMRENIAGYNCSYVPVDKLRVFDEALYVLLCGTGLGFSVERQYISKLPVISDDFHDTDTTIMVGDSKLGWAKAYKELLSLLVTGQIPRWDVSKVRPEGSRLKVFGGRASGPKPLSDLFAHTVSVFGTAKGRQLTSFEAHSLMCKVADIVVVGGVRRAALISLSNLSDDRMRHAKSGRWDIAHPEFARANNSVCYTETPDVEIYLAEFLALIESKSGERGIFNRKSAMKAVEAINKRAGVERRDSNHEFGINPCGEIILRPRQFCNLSEVIVREYDNLETLSRKIRTATILGTWQASLTNFKYISSEWKRNCEEEALLGVSMTGIMDNKITNGAEGSALLRDTLSELRSHATQINKTWASKIGINPASAITCVKPSGNTSQLAGCASGIHARHSKYYTRLATLNRTDPLAKFMLSRNFPYEDHVTDNASVLFKFPVKSPDGCVTRTDRTALEQLAFWLVYKLEYCDHNPSVTIFVKEHEWPDVEAWVWKNFDNVSGITFFSDHNYAQPPYQECDKQAYDALCKLMPKSIDQDELSKFEDDDNTEVAQTLACSAVGGCDI